MPGRVARKRPRETRSARFVMEGIGGEAVPSAARQTPVRDSLAATRPDHVICFGHSLDPDFAAAQGRRSVCSRSAAHTSYAPPRNPGVLYLRIWAPIAQLSQAPKRGDSGNRFRPPGRSPWGAVAGKRALRPERGTTGSSTVSKPFLGPGAGEGKHAISEGRSPAEMLYIANAHPGWRLRFD
jgi:hypothetical protein